MKPRSIRILLVEDNPGDVDLTLEVFAATEMSHEIHVVTDGQQALDFLRSRLDLLPDLILLDLNLPKLDGRAVLREAKSDPLLRATPIIVLTSSEARADVRAAYDLGANCYISKPVDLAEFERVVDALEQFWFNAAKLPGQSLGS